MAIIRKSKGKVLGNPLLEGVSGRLGNFTIKQYKDKIVLTNNPERRKRKPTAVQKEKRSLFKEAVTYAKRVLKDPKRAAAYARNLKGKRNVFQAALSDYLKSAK
jgi:hypothetical protein